MKDMTAHDETLDCKGLQCPMPVIKTKLKMDAMGAGKVLRMITSDPGSCKDIPAWAERVGHTLISTENTDDGFVFLLQKGD
jgi:tRNA 2-thiouridine synthesizing protein A